MTSYNRIVRLVWSNLAEHTGLQKKYHGNFCLFLILILVYFPNDFYLLPKIEKNINWDFLLPSLHLGMAYCILMIKGLFSSKKAVYLTEATAIFYLEWTRISCLLDHLYISDQSGQLRTWYSTQSVVTTYIKHLLCVR